MEAKKQIKNGDEAATEYLPSSFESPPDTTFDDICGLEDKKERIHRNLLMSVEKGLGTSLLPTLHIDGGAGCGKTRFGKAVAGELELPDLTYWHAKPQETVAKTSEGEDFEEYLSDLLDTARQEAPSVVLIEDGELVLENVDVFEQHTKAQEAMSDPVVTIFTTSESPTLRRKMDLSMYDHLPGAVYVRLERPDRDRWMAVFKDYLRKAFDGSIGAENLDYDRIHEKADWCPMHALGELCDRIRLHAEHDSGGDLRQETIEEVLEEMRKEMEENPLVQESAVSGDGEGEDRFLVGETDTTYEDVGGLDGVVRRIEEEMLVPRQYPELFEESNLGSTSGLLLHGPPGNGKTLLARALANETGRTFLSVRGPELKNKWFGESERMIRELFETAEENAPSIIFFDEFDAVAPSREDCTSCQRGPVNMLLTEMDGLEDRGDVLFLAATNRIEALDEAVLRPGRIGETIEVSPPDGQARKEIAEVYLSDLPTGDPVTPDWLARSLKDGTTGAEIEATCRRAARVAVRREGGDGGETPVIQRQDFETAIQRKDGGR
jgi:SpoVK/Ycf46/Vps4 family AAA+-type ATPase